MTHYSMYAKLNSTTLNRETNEELKDWKSFLKNNSDFIDPFDFVKDMAVEDPGDSPIISVRYGKQIIRTNATDFLPFFGTDIGFCSLVKPQLSFNPDLDHLPFSVKLFGPKSEPISYSRQIKPGAKVGKENGLTLLLDAEIFDYTFHRHVSEGFKIAVEHHLNQPLMSMNELDITPGLETQVAVTPVLYSTTDAARRRFTPEERGCYFEDELTLSYLPTELYRYDISNCLFEATYEKVLEICECTPYFHWAGVVKHRQFCRGKSLVCMNNIFSRIGEFTEIMLTDENGVQHKRTCLAACEDQQNNVAMTTSRIPNRQTLVEWPDFCLVVQKLYRVCNQPWKRLDLDTNYPDLCDVLLQKIDEFGTDIYTFVDADKCQEMFGDENIISTDYLTRNTTMTRLLDSIFKYSRDNLALVNIYIKPPVVTRILRDQRIPIIWFVANCGGILGLCMGFSIVTVFEVLHYVAQSLYGRVKIRIFTNTNPPNLVVDHSNSIEMRSSGFNVGNNSL